MLWTLAFASFSVAWLSDALERKKYWRRLISLTRRIDVRNYSMDTGLRQFFSSLAV